MFLFGRGYSVGLAGHLTQYLTQPSQNSSPTIVAASRPVCVQTRPTTFVVVDSACQLNGLSLVPAAASVNWVNTSACSLEGPLPKTKSESKPETFNRIPLPSLNYFTNHNHIQTDQAAARTVRKPTCPDTFVEFVEIDQLAFSGAKRDHALIVLLRLILAS